MIENHELREDIINEVSPDQINYTNPRVGDLVDNVGDALNYLFASLYPRYIGTFATPAALPVSANANDYAFVTNDGDGKSAGYVYMKIDGVNAWVKKYDVDWSVDSLLSSFLAETHPLYVLLSGRENGQTVYGGIATGQNLELNANSLDSTGRIITHNHLEALTDNVIDLGQATKRFKDIFLNGALKDGVITLTLANLKSAFDHVVLTDNPHSTSYDQLTNKLGIVTISGDVTGSVDLSTSGIKSLVVAVIDDSHTHTKTTLTNFDLDVYSKVKAVIQSADGLTFTANDTLQTLTPGQSDINTTEITDIDSPVVNRILASNALGTEWVNTTLNVELAGDLSGNANFVSSTGKVAISATVQNVALKKVDGINLNSITVTVGVHATAVPITYTGHLLVTGNKVYIDSSIFGVVTPQLLGEYTVTVVNANTFTIPANVTVGGSAYIIPNNAQLLFDSTTNTFNIRREFAEISHTEIQDVDLNDDHLQYARINGRIGGQTIKGGTDDLNDLVLESTTSAVKGKVKTKDSLLPFTNTSFAGTWSGLDLGTSASRFRHIYTNGELIGARIENLTTNPASSGQNLGRLIYNTPEDKLYYDNGTSFRPLSSANIPTIIVSMSIDTAKLVDLTTTLEAGKTTSNYTWVLYDSTTSQEFHPSIARTTSTSVTINSELPLTGSFVLKGI